ncbi:MAG: antibiotic biosynthesis monooxygenase [Actinobacteria bacterium]|nr:MAG: antibiotic biosynthesis monooxygenase [Actinomycetota bacterium]
MSGRIRVLIWYRCPPDKLDSFIETFHAISTQLAGVPGLLRSDLLQARREEGSVVLMSEWESAEAFATWEASARHRPTGAPLREYADTSRPYQFELYQILATRTANRPSPGHFPASSWTATTTTTTRTRRRDV